MSIITIHDIEKVRFAAPDLGEMRRFLLDFGLQDLGPQSDGILRMHANGPAPVVHETEKGPPEFRAVTFRAKSIADLETLAVHENVSVEEASGPAGGRVVRLLDPDGFAVEVTAGGMDKQPPAQTSCRPWNTGAAQLRKGVSKRISPGPSNVLRLGHVVFIVSDLRRTWDWYSQRFGFVVSDDVRDFDGNPVAMFVRCHRGDELVDHHVLNFAMAPGKSAQFHHAAFEVTDLDDLMIGHDNLKAKGYRHIWGIGRHLLGSQVFDYWLDPFGNRIEHWTDGDVFSAERSPLVTDLPTMLGHQWGPPAPLDFV